MGKLLALLPLWAYGIGFVMILAGTLQAGVALGRKFPAAQGDGGQLTTLQAAALGLLALVLSFTYSYVSTRYDNRKLSMLTEANAIGTAYLRAGFAPAPLGERLRSRLEEYARTRVATSETAGTPERLAVVLAHSEELQQELWSIMEEIAHTVPAGPLQALLAQSVNEVIDLHTIRLFAANDRLPGVVGSMLLVIAVLAMLITGYNSGVSGVRNNTIGLVFAAVLAFVLMVIIDLDRSLSGFVQVSQQPLLDLIRSMETGTLSP